MRSLIVVAFALGACKGGGGFGHALGGLGHAASHAAGGLGHVASGLGHGASHVSHNLGKVGGGVAVRGVRGVGGGGGAVDGVAQVAGQMLESAVDIAANIALNTPGVVVVVDGVDADHPCVLPDGSPACDEGYECVANAGEALCVPLTPPGTTP
jgi:hypothetical protein